MSLLRKLNQKVIRESQSLSQSGPLRATTKCQDGGKLLILFPLSSVAVKVPKKYSPSMAWELFKYTHDCVSFHPTSGKSESALKTQIDPDRLYRRQSKLTSS
jgi:hypothetical protein